jgi:hypothetical protein
LEVCEMFHRVYWMKWAVTDFVIRILLVRGI